MTVERLERPVGLGRAERDAGVSTVEAAYTAYYPALSRYATWLTGDPHVAADLVQEAFARLAARWIGVREPRAYLSQVVTNLARSEWRRQRNARSIEVEAGTEADHANGVAVRDAVFRLPRKDREVVWLHYWADLSIAEISHSTGVPEGTVKSRLFNARQRLARSLEGLDGRA